MSSSNKENPNSTPEISRRSFLTLTSAVAAATAVDAVPGISPAQQAQAAPLKKKAASGKQPNILFVFTDQERYLKDTPRGFRLPAHERLQKAGITFHNHYCPAVMCTSSRSVLMTGLQTADNKMFENADMKYVKALSTEVPTVGHMLRKAGYYTAYKGKWHLNAEFDQETPEKLFTKEMDEYGFADFVWPGDVLAHTLGGYKHDQMIAGSAVAWLRDKGQSLNAEQKPWALFVSLVNPHDIMYFNTDLPDEQVQDNGQLMMHAARAPDHATYQRKWQFKLPSNWQQPFDAAGRPAAHGEFDRCWGYTLGRIPAEPQRWQRFNDFYYNSLQMVDQQLGILLDELAALNLDDNTIIVFTSDHGEMGGAHGLRGKGPMPYQEVIHLPLYIVHPQVKGGQHCKALTGHIDLVPSLLSMAGVTGPQAAEYAGRQLPGKDISALFKQPSKAGLHAIRESVLFTYSGLATNDSELIRQIAAAVAQKTDPMTALKATGYQPNFKKRGSVRTVFDGRYKFTRYFSPLERNTPQTLDEIYQWNDVELYDLQQDPQEMHNLAPKKGQQAELVLQMNAKLNAVIQAEFGADDGREMPDFKGIEWQIDRIDL